MSFFRSLLERRSSLATPEKWVVDWLTGGAASAAGVTVTPDTAMYSTAVFGAIRVIAENLATLPCKTYRRLENGGKQADPTHPLYPILHDQPNRWQTSIEFFEMLTGHAVARGNGYAQVVGSPGAAIEELIPLHPDRVRVKVIARGQIVYEYTPPEGGAPMILFPGEVLHLRGFSSDGYVGMSPISLAREAIGLTLAAEEFGSRFFSNGARPGGLIEGAKPMSKEAKDAFKKSWYENHGGLQNQGRVAMLEEGMKYVAIGISPEDSQFLETRKFQVAEIARLFRVPPHMIQDLERSTNNNIEHQGIEFVTYTLRPWLVRWEKVIRRDLMTESWQKTHFVEFLVDGLLRGDAVSRSTALATQRQNGAINGDEWREIENRNPTEDESGKIYLVNGSMVRPQDAGKPPANLVPQAGGNKRSLELSEVGLRAGFRRMLEDAMGRVTRREAQLMEKRGSKPIAAALDGHAEYVARTLEPILAAFADCIRPAGTEERSSQFVHSYVVSLALRHVERVESGKPDDQDKLTTFETALLGAICAAAA